MTEADRWPAALSNLNNMIEQNRADQIIVVINGTAIYVLQGDNDWTQAMKKAADHGTAFVVCERSIRNHKIARESLPTWCGTVPAAIPAIGELTQQGLAYIKP